MIGVKLRAGALMAWDLLVVLLTDRGAQTCGEQTLGDRLTCERRERHRGMHAMISSHTSAVWGRKA